jgi:hypothetical protein
MSNISFAFHEQKNSSCIYSLSCRHDAFNKSAYEKSTKNHLKMCYVFMIEVKGNIFCFYLCISLFYFTLF